ncbi:MAG TPA: radical SAM protein [Terriglobales bacterium]|nr:radical SAM protein [Terriglobales bacterium]
MKRTKRVLARPKTEVVRRTYSICPTCMRRIGARHVRRGDKIYLEKTCPECGGFSTLIWSGKVDIVKWRGGEPEIKPGENENCPSACGICPEHRQGTCCVLLEVTRRCDLGCPFCFAQGEAEGADRDIEDVKKDLAFIVSKGGGLVQLSGGEPTLRDDLPEIVAAAHAAGIRYVQLNTNGIRLAQDEAYVEALAAAGLSFVFMQFDGTKDKIFEALRGRPLFDIKKRAIELCDKYHIGVTLVPMLVPGVNTDNIGDILRFAANRSPAVRGVHFQPVSYFGRAPKVPDDADRFTLDALIDAVYEQSYGLVPRDTLLPSRCDHPLCGFHGDYIVREDGTLYPLHRGQADCCCGVATAEQNREFVARRWLRRDEALQPRSGGGEPCTCGETGETEGSMGLDEFADRIKSHGFTVTAMAFQDRWNLDLERLRRCSLHVCDGERLVPFCAYYIGGGNG